MLLKRLLIASVAGLPVVLPIAAFADGDFYDHDHDLARDLYERGEIRAFSDILRGVQARALGQVVGVELKQLGSRWVYRLQVVDAKGHRSVLDIDAGPASPTEPRGSDP